MRQIKKHEKPDGRRLTRKALWLVLALLLTAGISAAAYAAQGAGLFQAFQENNGYSVSTKDGVTQNGKTTPIDTNTDGKPDWRPASDSEDNNTYYLYLEGAEESDEPVVTLVMEDNVWTYYFTVVDSETAEYYVTEFINREGDYTLTTDPSYQFEDENGKIIYYTMTGSNGSVTLYNSTNGETPAFGSLTLTKQLVDSDGNEVAAGTDSAAETDSAAGTDSAKFQFTITLSYTLVTNGEEVTKGSAVTAALLTGSQTYGDLIIDWTNTSEPSEDGITTTVYTGSAVTYLAAGETVTLTDIPAGVTYSVTENETDGYTANFEYADGTIEKDTESSVVCTNTENPPGNTPGEPTGSVIVKKLVTNADGSAAEDSTDGFSMRLSLTGLNPKASYNYAIYDADGEVVERGTEDGETFECSYSYTALADGSADVSFTLMNGQYAEFTGLPVGCCYQVMESAIGNYTASYELSGGGENPIYASSSGANYEDNKNLTTAKETLDKAKAEADTPVTVTFTNKLPEVSTGNDTVSVTVTKLWQDADGKNENAAHEGQTITIYLLQTLDPDRLSEGNVIGTAFLNGTDDNWTYTFSDLERYNDGGLPYYYYVREAAVDGYMVSVSVSNSPCLDENGAVLYKEDEKGNDILDNDNQKIIAYDDAEDYSFIVTNRTSRELPFIGGSGTIPYSIGGLLLLAGAGIFLLYRTLRLRRKRVI